MIEYFKLFSYWLGHRGPLSVEFKALRRLGFGNYLSLLKEKKYAHDIASSYNYLGFGRPFHWEILNKNPTRTNEDWVSEVINGYKNPPVLRSYKVEPYDGMIRGGVKINHGAELLKPLIGVSYED